MKTPSFIIQNVERDTNIRVNVFTLEGRTLGRGLTVAQANALKKKHGKPVYQAEYRKQPAISK